jgi:nicotinamide mononucleotide transporter
MKSTSRKFTFEITTVFFVAALLLITAWQKWLPLELTEAFGFATGAICVWLVTKGHIWNWPVGLANNIFFAILFWRTRLFADFGLQGVYLALGIYGWWAWLHGGGHKSRLTVSRTSRYEWVALTGFLIFGTWGLWKILIAVNGAAPFWDAATTAICLCAQYLLCRKRFENWFFWIAADIIYVPLYLSRGLPLTAILYGGFFLLCLVGLQRWRKELPS